MIRRAEAADLDQLTALTLALWPDCAYEERWNDMADLLASSEAAVFLLMDGENAAGFAQCQLRHDYVEGTESSPVGYLEGIYVAEPYRGKGCARELLKACERWAASWGCTEFASDCELHNTDSLAFHLKAGFTEANRIICFTKKL
ncbi:MAG: GNAT family N-acetyltransferase [bacterium]|nr:GNAT family N-acetyltransferase [bacterium]